MDRKEAISLVLAEAYADNGLAMIARHGGDPGGERMERLLAAIRLLTNEIAAEDTLDRLLAYALLILRSEAPENANAAIKPTAASRSSYHQQLAELSLSITMLFEEWENWPEPESYMGRGLKDPPISKGAQTPPHEKFEGYRAGDLTYVVVVSTEALFPVRVARLGFNVVEVEPLSEELCHEVCADFLDDRLNRCFQSARGPTLARFGGSDERLGNFSRASGPELRLLPHHYATPTIQAIRTLHAENPQAWPLPTGAVYERWFKD